MNMIICEERKEEYKMNKLLKKIEMGVEQEEIKEKLNEMEGKMEEGMKKIKGELEEIKKMIKGNHIS